jgi:hypothetical protein
LKIGTTKNFAEGIFIAEKIDEKNQRKKLSGKNQRKKIVAEKIDEKNQRKKSS